MNERIRELAEQAGIEFDDDFPLEPETIYYLKLSDFEKFAELIVKECVSLMESERDMCESTGTYESRGYYERMAAKEDAFGDAASLIKYHFGVDK